MLYFFHKYMIAPTVMQLGSLNQFMIYLYKLCYTVYVFMKYGTLHKKSDMWFTGGRIFRFEHKNINDTFGLTNGLI
jgi:hypothetical protein